MRRGAELAGAIEQRIRINRRAGPPAFVEIEASHGKVEVGRVLRSIAGGADVADDVTAAEELPFVQAGRVGVEMRVVVAVALIGIELVDGQAAGNAGEELFHGALVRCYNWRA